MADLLRNHWPTCFGFPGRHRSESLADMHWISQIIRDFIIFPLQIMGLAIVHRDHLLYSRFSNLYPIIYYRALQVEDTKLRASIINLSSQYLIDHHRFHLSPRLKNLSVTNEDLKTFKDYYTQLYIVWNSLLKASIDDRDYNFFAVCAHAARNIFKEFFPDVDDMALEILEIRNGLIDGQEDAKKTLEEEIQNKKIILSLKVDLLNTQKSMFFGLGGWLLHLYEKKKISLDDFTKFIDAINVEFLDLGDFYLIYSSLRDLDRPEHLFNWISWETEEWDAPYGEVRSGALSFTSFLDKYYVLRSFELTPSGDNQIPKLTPNTRSKLINDLVESQFSKLLEDVLWKPLLERSVQGSPSNKASKVIEIHRNAAQAQEEAEEFDIVARALDDDLVKSFINDVNEEWSKLGIIRSLIKSIGRYQDKRNQVFDPPKNAFGIHILTEKGAFIRQEQVAYLDWGKSYGRELARIEDEILTTQIFGKKELSCEEATFSSTLLGEIDNFRLSGLKPIIFFSGLEIYRQFNGLEKFTPSWRIKNHPYEGLGLMGLFDEIPAISLEMLQENSLLLIDISAFGILSQYKVPKSNTFPLDVRISILSLEQAISILEREPSWRKDQKTEETLDEETALRKVQQHVDLSIWEFAQFEQINPSAVTKIIYIPNDKA